MEEGKKLDWATAETLAFGSLLSQGKRQLDSKKILFAFDASEV